MLVALGGYLVSRFFGPRRADADSDAQGQHAITRSLLAAVNSGQTHDTETWVAEGFAAYVNGYTMAKDGLDRGPELLAAVVDYHRASVGEPFWELYDEVLQKVDRTTSTIAIRFVARGRFGPSRREIEMAGFLRVVDNHLAEIRLVTDMTIFNQLRATIGLQPLD